MEYVKFFGGKSHYSGVLQRIKSDG